MLREELKYCGASVGTPPVVLNVVTSTYLWRSSIINVTVFSTALVI